MDNKTVREAPSLLPRQRLLIGLLASFDYPLSESSIPKAAIPVLPGI